MTKVLPFSENVNYTEVLAKLKDEFEKEWANDTPSSNQLKGFNFLQVLGQGAFGYFPYHDYHISSFKRFPFL